MDFQQGYNQSEFKRFLKLTFLKDNFEEKNEQLSLVRKTQFFVENEIYKIGEIQGFEKEVAILQIKQKSKNDPRITLTKDTFKLMQDYGIRNALIVFWIDDSSPWRFSLLTTNFTEDFKKELSSPKRYSYLLGPGEKTKTPERYLIKQGVVKNFEDLLSRFDVEVVRKEFFKLYVNLFLELYDEIQHNPTFHVLIQQNKIEPVSFAKNLMGKMIFLYFIQKKGWLGITDKSKPFGEGDRDFFKNNFDKLAHDADLFQKHSNFYNDFLEPLFYSGLNQKNPDDWHPTLQMKVPYLNGGLFEEEYDWKNTTINLNNQIFKNIITSFDTYNFTIDEDDPIDREIAVDPEMLGKIFESMISVSKDNINDIMEAYHKAKAKNKITYPNPENILNIDIGKDINKKFGAFYTPREIVHYMTKESLIAYLTNKLYEKYQNKSEEEIESIVRKLFEYKDKHLTQQEIEAEKKDGYELLKTYVFDIQDALKTVKILDPAVGSGAFPMGILQEILGLRRYLIDIFGLQQESDFEIKKQIILNTVYGVDIDTGAIDIARLRFRLSLIVDATKPVPLPNLDFKFICANTLIPLEQDTLFTNKETIEKLRILRNKYFSCDDHNQKEELKKEFESLKLKLSGFGQRNKAEFKTLKEWNAYIHEIVKQNADKKNRQILERDPFDTNKSNEWFDSQMMFGVDGFDIVIGNPPYIQLQNKGGILADLYEHIPYESFSRMGDIYCLFYEKAFDLLKKQGICAFITSNKRMRAGYGEKLRHFFAKNTNPLILVDLGPDVFETATVDSNILIGQKKKVSTFHLKALDLVKEKNIKNIESFHDRFVILNKLSKDAWTILDPIQFSIKKKMEKIGTPLKDRDIKINYGIKTGYNEAFIIDGKKKDELIAQDPKSAEIIKPILRGRDIRKYGYKFADLWLIFIPWHFPLHKDQNIIGASKKAEEIFSKEYKTIYRHLLQYKDKLSDRNKAETGIRYEWYALQRCANTYYEEFEKEKIIYGQFRKGDYSYDNQGNFLSSNEYLIVSESANLKYLIAILNNKINPFFQGTVSNSLSGQTSIFQKDAFEKLPIPQISSNQQQPFIHLVDQILEKKKNNPDADTSDLEHQIDQMVYELYGLTDEEIKVVEESFK